MELTPQGRELAQGVDQALAHVAKVIDQIQHTPRQNQLAINIPPTFATRWLAPRLADFRKHHPHIDLSITNNFVRHPRDAKPYSCLITFDQQAWPDCDSRLLMHERHVMVASPDLWRDGLPPRLENVTLLHVLNGEERLPVWEKWIKNFALTHIDPAPGLSFSTLDQAINTAIMGAGVAVVDAAMVTRELASCSLRRLNQLEMQGSYGYWFINLTKDQQSRALVTLFRDWLQEQLAQAEDIRRVVPTP
ncbi:Transcriptional regulator, LysR family [Polaromonas sp. CG9_12]|nr:Transcriptional regulator, LysR family [Polaromonas sp. CG9_12]